MRRHRVKELSLSIAHELAAVLGTVRTPGDFYATGRPS